MRRLKRRAGRAGRRRRQSSGSGFVRCNRRDRVVFSAEDSDQTARSSGRGRSLRVARSLRRPYQDYDVIPFLADCVGSRLIEIEHHARDHGLGAVLRGAHAMHAFGIDLYIFCIVEAAGVGKVEQNPVGMHCNLDRGSNGSAKRDLDAHAGVHRTRRHVLHRNFSGGGLGCCTQHQQQTHPQLFLNRCHCLLPPVDSRLARKLHALALGEQS